MTLNLFSLVLKYNCDTQPMCSRLIFLKEIKEKDFRFQKRSKEPFKQHTKKNPMMFDSLIALKTI